jgi:hypothetical protein
MVAGPFILDCGLISGVTTSFTCADTFVAHCPFDIVKWLSPQ